MDRLSRQADPRFQPLPRPLGDARPRPPSVLLDKVEEVVIATFGGNPEGRHALVAGLNGQAQRAKQVHSE